jgi:transposase InsO family protein
VAHARETQGISEQRACRVTGQHRSTQRYEPRPRDEERALLKHIDELVLDNPRRGCRYITKVLRKEGWRVNYKRVHRLWKREGYKVRKKRRQKRAVGEAANACDERCATGVNDVWAWDFIEDRLVDGRQLKCLVIID